MVLGAVLGGLASSVGDFLNNANAREFITKLGGQQGLTNAYLAAELGFAGVIAAAYGIQATLRLRAEEAEGRAEPVLATAVGRRRHASSHLAVAVAGSAALLLLAGLSAGLVRAADTGDVDDIARLVAGAVVQLPAVWVLIGITLAAYGTALRTATIGWIALAGFVVLAELGPLLDVNHWIMDLSPFAHVPKQPGTTFTVLPELVLTALAAALIAFGLAAFRRRDLA